MNTADRDIHRAPFTIPTFFPRSKTASKPDSLSVALVEVEAFGLAGCANPPYFDLNSDPK